MSGYSNVGNRGVYEAGDQRNVSEAERKAQESDPYNEGKENSHNNLDSSKNLQNEEKKELDPNKYSQRMSDPSPTD